MAAQKWNFKTQFPTDSNFVNRITEASFGPSKSSGNPMITLKCEVVNPAEVEIGGDTYTIAGVETINYYTTKTLTEDGGVNVEKTQGNAKRLKELYAALGLDTENIDPENPDLSGFKGKVVLTQMSPDIEEQRKNPTAEQLAKGQKQGDVMKNPVTGKALVSYRPKIREIFGLAPTGVGGASY